MSERQVVVVGSGPTGLMLAGELALAGVDVLVLERRTTTELVGTRARGFHSRTIEILDQRGLADRFLAQGRTAQVMRFGDTALDVASLPSRHPYTLGLGQSGIEEILLGWVESLGVEVRRGADVRGFVQDDTGVDVQVGDGDVRAAYLVGTDGGRSAIRRAAGIEMVGPPATRSHLIAEVQVTEEPPAGMRIDDIGVQAINVLPDGSVGLVVTEQELGPQEEPTLDELKSALVAAFGSDFGVHDPSWMSRFTDATRQAAAYRDGRVLIAGDACHTHPPTGGQGIGLGVQDAVNLGWKLAQVVKGISPDSLLDSYQAERHPATARVLDNVMVQAMLQRGDTRTVALRHVFADIVGHDQPRADLAAFLQGLDGRTEVGDGHAALGRRVPDLELVTPMGPQQTYALLHAARPLLLDFAGDLDVAGWADRVDLVRAEPVEWWELPVVGTVPAPTGVLVRPDGHVAWAGQGSDEGLREALARWFGEAS